MSGSVRPCGDVGLPHGLVYARRYVIGYRCDRHTPSALRGLPEPPPGPGWPSRNHLNTPTEPPVKEPPS
ncbi:hypothetical protein [Streptomyces sp. NPDC096095]|uniref:hypothetical protein n=1 Tax=Streptomyces sp. NPDC096095 TaxID=3155545 RepID=UPI00332733C8